MSSDGLERVGGFGGGFSGIESYYTAKIDRLEAEEALARDNRFNSIARSAVSSDSSTQIKPYELPYFDRSELKQSTGSMSAQNAAMNNVRSAPV